MEVTVEHGVLWIQNDEDEKLVSGSSVPTKSKDQTIRLYSQGDGQWAIYLVHLERLGCSHGREGSLLRISPPFRLHTNPKPGPSRMKRDGEGRLKSRYLPYDPSGFETQTESMCDECLSQRRLTAFWVKNPEPNASEKFTPANSIRTATTAPNIHSAKFKFRTFEDRSSSDSQVVLVAHWVQDPLSSPGTIPATPDQCIDARDPEFELDAFNKAIRSGNLKETKRLANILGHDRANTLFYYRGPLACCVHSRLAKNCEHEIVPGNKKYHAIATWLIDEWGADVNFLSPNGSTPLHVASQRGAQDMVNFLISKGANLLATTAEGWTPLHNALKKENEEAKERGPRVVPTRRISRFLADYMRNGCGQVDLEAVLSRSHCGNMWSKHPDVYEQAFQMVFPIQPEITPEDDDVGSVLE